MANLYHNYEVVKCVGDLPYSSGYWSSALIRTSTGFIFPCKDPWAFGLKFADNEEGTKVLILS